jgi:peptidoglycan/LPS O-acetylase OafA/YrhL
MTVRSAQQNVTYRPEVDGLRAVAVLAVILFHAGLRGFGGGYVGVDVFFVISGYLITLILVNETKKGSFSIVGFYERRARRILPALFAVILACLPVAWLGTSPAQLAEFARSVVAVCLFASNFFFWRTSGYFDAAVEEKPLLHTWSLAVEEQFYVVYPVLFLLLWRLGPRRFLALAAGGALLSLGLSEIGSRTQPVANFYLPIGRAWELLIGAMVAVSRLPERGDVSRGVKEAGAALGMALIAVAVFAYGKKTPFPGVYALVPTLGTALVLVFAGKDTPTGRLLSSGPMVGLGLISYSAYLWHYPLFAFFRIQAGRAPTLAEIAALIAATLLLAYITWVLVETPVRRRQIFSRPQVFAASAAVSVLLLAFGMLVARGALMPERYRGIDLAAAEYGGAGYEFGLSKLGDREARSRFVLYGDSHAMQYMSSLDALARSHRFAFTSLLHSACFSLPNLTNVYQGSVHPDCVALLAELRNIIDSNGSKVVIAYRWPKQLARPDGTQLGFSVREPQGQDELVRSLRALVAELGPNRTIVLVGNVPSSNLIPEGGYLGCLAKIGHTCPSVFPRTRGELYELNAKLRELAGQYPNVVFVDPYDALCDATTCYVMRDGKLLYSDHAHLSKYGAALVVKHFEQTLEQLAGAKLAGKAPPAGQ